MHVAEVMQHHIDRKAGLIHVTKKLLNHVSGSVSGVAAIYNRHAYADEMRAAIADWESRVGEIVAAN